MGDMVDSLWTTLPLMIVESSTGPSETMFRLELIDDKTPWI
jgi:hypothetical protein